MQEEAIEWVGEAAESDISSGGGGTRPGSPPAVPAAAPPPGPDPAAAVNFSNQQGGINPFLTLPDPVRPHNNIIILE